MNEHLLKLNLPLKRYRVELRRNLPISVKKCAEQVDGKVYNFYFAGTQDDDELYPGEDMWMPIDAEYPSNGPSWIASGDLLEIAE